MSLLSSSPALKKSAGSLPEASDFWREPATWYLFCASKRLKAKPFSKFMLGKRLVGYRTSRGEVCILDASCAHLGADLGRGSVVEDTIRCPFHHWRFGPDGRCVEIPGCSHSPNIARQRVYPAIERHGFVFFFYGPEPFFPLPFFSDCHSNDFVAGIPFQFEVDSPWYMLVANGFDGQHFQAVHDRKLITEPTVDTPAPFARRMRFAAEVQGSTIFDRALRQFVGKRVEISITSWGGPHVLVEGRFGRAHSRLLVASQPMQDGHTLSDVIVFARRSAAWQGGRTLDALNLFVRRLFTQAFLRYDTDRLSGVRYQPESLIEQDYEMIAFFKWLTTLPCSEYELPTR